VCFQAFTKCYETFTRTYVWWETVAAAVRNARVPNDKLHRVTDKRLAEADRRDLHGLC